MTIKAFAGIHDLDKGATNQPSPKSLIAYETSIETFRVAPTQNLFLAEWKIADVYRPAPWSEGVEDAAIGCEDRDGPLNRDLRVQRVVRCDHPLVREGECVPDEDLDGNNGHGNGSEISPRVPNIGGGKIFLESTLSKIVSYFGKEKSGRDGAIRSIEEPRQQQLGFIREDFLKRPLEGDGRVQDVVQTLPTLVSKLANVLGAIAKGSVEVRETLAP